MDSAEGAIQPPAFTFFAAPARAAASTSTLRAPPPPPPSLQRNAQGGVLITEGDVEEALAVFAGPGASGRGATAVPAARLAEALRPFQPSLTKEEVGRLLGGAPSLTLRDAQNILVDNSLHSFDPLREAHRALCGGGELLTHAAFNRACEALGQQPLTEVEWRTLMESCGQGSAEALGAEAARGMVARERERRERGGAAGGAARGGGGGGGATSAR
jgi:hypothetical protein